MQHEPLILFEHLNFLVGQVLKETAGCTVSHCKYIYLQFQIASAMDKTRLCGYSASEVFAFNCITINPIRRNLRSTREGFLKNP